MQPLLDYSCVCVDNHVFVCLLQCNSENSTNVRISTRQIYTYRVKVVNRAKKSEYSIKRLQYTQKFSSVEDLRMELQSLDVADKDVGYIEPGHGAKGRQMWLETQEDLDEMYTTHGKRIKSEILLWCYMKAEAGSDQQVRSRKRPLSPSNSDSTGPKRNASSKKLEEVEKIVKELQEKHAAKYSIEKLNAWAHLLHIGKHDSYETPPDYPYFGKSRKEKRKSSESQTGTSDETTTSQTGGITNSPSKRLGLRGECIEQLSKWHSLLEKGAISVQQYDELKATIMGDLFKLGPTGQ